MKKTDDFDTHWIARGRHIQLLSGVFQGAKYALRKSSFERFDIRHDGLMNQDYRLDVIGISDDTESGASKRKGIE